MRAFASVLAILIISAQLLAQVPADGLFPSSPLNGNANDGGSQPDRHVVLVIIDGARYSETLGDSLGRFIPRMRDLARQGVVVDSMMNDSVTVTKRAIPAIWCGSWSIPKDTMVNGVANQYATVPTVWEYFRKARSVDSTHALYIMKSLASPWIQSYVPQYGPAYWPWYVLQGNTDMEVWNIARGKLQTYHPELAVIYLPDVDSSPSRGWTAYTQAIVTADSIVGMLWDLLQSDPVFRNTTTLLVTNDHGRHLDGILNGFVSHGDGCRGCRHIMLLAAGAGVIIGKHTSIQRSILDITPTIGSLLQFPTPYASGKVMTEILAPTGIEIRPESFPTTMSLEQNFPNPFNPTTQIQILNPKFQILNLAVYDLLGREVAVLVDEKKDPGRYSVTWDASHCPSGIYFYQLKAENQTHTRKMLLIR